MSCINKSDKKYQLLVRDYGDYVAELLTRLNTPKGGAFIIPTLEQSKELIRNQKNKQYKDFKEFLIKSDVINKEIIKSKLKGVIWESKQFDKLLVTTGFTTSRSLTLNGLENRHVLINNIITLQNINKLVPLFIIRPSIGRSDRYVVEIDEYVLRTLQISKIEKNSLATSELKIPGEPKIFKDAYRRLSENDYINQTYFKDSETMSVKTMLEQIIDKTYLHGELAKKFLPHVKENMTISLVDNIDKQIIWTESGKIEVLPVGLAYSDINKILIKRNTNENETLILHEILHLLTYYQLRQNKKVNKDFQKLFNHAINNLPQSDYYSLSNLDEFIVGLFTNSILIQDLQKIPPLKGIKKYKNLFEELLDVILKAFNTKKSDNFYEQAISVASHIVGSKIETTEQEKLEREKEENLKIINEQEKNYDLSEDFVPPPEDFFNEEETVSTDNDFQRDIDYFDGDQALLDQDDAPERYLAVTPQEESTNEVIKEIEEIGKQLEEQNKPELENYDEDGQIILDLNDVESNKQNLILRAIDILETNEADYAFSVGLNKNNSLQKILELLKVPKSQISSIMERSESIKIDEIKDEDITYTNEEGLPCAEAGLKSSNFTKGGTWEIIKELKGPSHAQGGIDIEISNGGVRLSNKQGEFKAKNGLVVPAFLKDAYNNVKEGVSSAVSKVSSNIEKIPGKVQGTAKKIKQTGKNLVGETKEVVGSAVDNVKEAVSKPYNEVKDFVYGVDVSRGDIPLDVHVKSDVFDFSPVKVPEPTTKEITHGLNRNNYIYSDSKGTPKRCNTPECTAAITLNYLKNREDAFVDRFNARGSGWTMQTNLENAGATSITNVFRDLPLSEKKKMTPRQVINYVNRTTNNEDYKNKLRENLKPGDFVSLLYPLSESFGKAKAQSRGEFLTTHGGEIVEINGKRYVRDNVSGKYRYRDLETVLEGKDFEKVRISGAVGLTKTDSYDYFEDPNYDLNFNHKDKPKADNLFSAAAYRASVAQDNNKAKLMELHNLTEEEWDKLKVISRSIMMKESNFGRAENNETYNKDAGFSRIGKVKDFFGDIAEHFNLKEESRTLGNIKFRNYYSDEELQKIGLLEYIENDDSSVMESPEISGIMVMDALVRNRNKFKEVIKNIPQEDLIKHKDLIEKLEYISWNQGFDKIKINIDRFAKTKDEKELKKYFIDKKTGKPEVTYGDIIKWFNEYQVKK